MKWNDEKDSFFACHSDPDDFHYLAGLGIQTVGARNTDSTHRSLRPATADAHLASGPAF